MNKRQILLIENQQTQYQKIHDLFRDNCSEKFNIFPKCDKFIPFISWVRIYVNTENEETRKNKALEKIIKTIIDDNIELILMDYKLGAPFMCWTGVELGKQINLNLKNAEKATLPIVFMSKDLVENNKKYCEELEEYEKQKFPAYRNVHKGYFGKQILEEDYFKARIIAAIDLCLQDTAHQEVYKIIKNQILGLAHDNTGSDFQTEKKLKKILKSIEDGETIKNETIEFIKEKKDSRNFNDFNNDKIKNYKNG